MSFLDASGKPVKHPVIDPERSFSRQALRRMGRAETAEQVKNQAPAWTRKECRKMARALHQEAWSRRDPKLIHKVTHGLS